MTVQAMEIVTGNGSELSSQEWATRINQRYGAAVDAVLDVGRLLIAAKTELPHGAYTAMIESDLVFGVRAAQQFVRIAQHPVLSNAKHVSCLPSSWGTLAVIARLPEDVVENMIESGQITSETKRTDINRIIHRKRNHENQAAWAAQLAQEQRNARAVSHATRPTEPLITPAQQIRECIQSAIRELEGFAVELGPEDPDYAMCHGAIDDLYRVIDSVLYQ